MNGEPEPSQAALRRRVTIVNRKGLHARAAAKFVKLARQFDAVTTVVRNGVSVGGESIMGLMMLAASEGSDIELSASGPQAEEALNALIELVARKFDED